VPVEAALLDVNGTLIDMNYHHALAWYRAFRRHGIVLPLWRIHRSIGMGGNQLVPALVGEDTDAEQLAEKLCHQWAPDKTNAIHWSGLASSSPVSSGRSPRRWRTTTRTSTSSNASRVGTSSPPSWPLSARGRFRRYRGGRYHCVTVDEFDYFLTHAGDAGWIVNRKRSAVAGWDDEPAPSHDPREVIWHDVERELISREQAEAKLRELG
jgi:phosphoglycolate phosphatase-like HAD superfamily hydrolase